MRLNIFSIAALSIVCVAPARAQISNSDLIAQAKKEGRVVWYTTVSIPESQAFAALFKRQFPSINVDIIRTGSSALVNRLISEHNAKKYLADVLQGFSSRGGYGALKQRGIHGRYESPEYKYLPPDLKDPAGYRGSQYQNTFVLAYNTRMVKPPDVPKTYDDLLKPMWKGKKILNDTENHEWFDGLCTIGARKKALLIFASSRSRSKSFSAAPAAAFNSWRRENFR